MTNEELHLLKIGDWVQRIIKDSPSTMVDKIYKIKYHTKDYFPKIIGDKGKLITMYSGKYWQKI